MTMDRSNYLYHEGDVLYIQTKPNGRGRFNITQFVLNLSGGISQDSPVKVLFRTVENGVIKSDWFFIAEVQTYETTISNISYNVPRNAILQVCFKRISDGEPIRFNSLQITGGAYFVEIKPTPTIDDSMFADINRQYETDELENNLFKKLYFRGIVPNYIKRADNLSKEEDGDYIALFSTIARFFTLIIRFFKRWEKINDYEEMLKEILRNNGIQFNESKIGFDKLSFLVHNIYSEISKRGTLEVFRLEGDERPDGSVVEIDGELMRTINSDKATEVLFETIFKYEMGWCLSKSSPMYSGIPNFCCNLDKLHFSSHYYSDISEWDNILTFGSKSLQPISDRDSVMRFNGVSGIGRISESTEDSNYFIKVDACMDYEIMFGLRVIDNNGDLYASVDGFSFYNVKLNDAFILPDKSEITSNFFNSETCIPLSSFITNKWYYIRFIIKAYASQNQISYKLNIGRGNELFFNNAFVRYILPTIRITGGTIDVCNFHIRPLVRGTNINCIKGDKFPNCFSLGFLKTSGFFHLYLRNRNTTMSQEEVRDFINKYLLTYSSTNLITFID